MAMARVTLADHLAVLAAQGGEACQRAVVPDHHRIAVEIVVRAKEDWIIHAGVDNFTRNAGAYGRPVRVGEIQTVVWSIATTAGGAKLVTRCADLVVLASDESRANPKVVAQF